MGTVSRLPEKLRTTAPIIVSETEAFDSVHTLIRQLSRASDDFPTGGHTLSHFPAISNSGLLGITVPSESGGADVSNIILGEIMLSLASASQAAAAALSSHFHAVELLRGSPAAGPCDYFYGRALAGELFLTVGDIDGVGLRLAPELGKPGMRLNGTVASVIDPIHADWIVLRATDGAGEHAVFVPRMTSGLRLTPDRISFNNVHIDADCFVPLSNHLLSTAEPLATMLQSAQKLGMAERGLNDMLASHARFRLDRRAFDTTYLPALGLAASRIESGKAALERAGRNIDTAQVNGDAETVQKATFSSAIALSSACEAFDLSCDVDSDHPPLAWGSVDPYGHGPIGARLLESSLH